MRIVRLLAVALVACSSFSSATNEAPDAGTDAPPPPAPAPADAAADAPLDVAAGPRSAYRDAIVADRPIAYWRMSPPANETVIHDEMGGDDLVAQGSFTPGVPGATADGDSAIDFDGKSGFATANDARKLDFVGTVPFTIELWAKRRAIASPDSFQGLFANLQGNPGNRTGYQLYETANDAGLVTQGEYDDIGKEAVFLGPALATDTWTHVAYVFTGASSTSEVLLYVGGTKVLTKPITGQLETRTSDFVVGATSAANYHFPGAIDEVAVYDKALSAVEIATHIAAAKTQ